MKSTKKHVAKTTLKPAEKPVMAVATDDESDEEEDLATLTKLQLVDLAESLKINTTGNKADLLKRINENVDQMPRQKMTMKRGPQVFLVEKSSLRRSRTDGRKQCSNEWRS